MKILPLFLAGSLVANAALLVAVLKPSAPDQAPAVTKPVIRRSSAATAPTLVTADLQDALATGDAAALTAAGLSPEAARQLIIGRAYARQRDRIRALRNPTDDGAAYWQRESGPEGFGRRTREQRLEMRKIQREFQDEVRAALGEDPYADMGRTNSLLSFLPADRREQLRRIEEDYSELMGEVYGEAGSVQLPSDREKLKLLQTEKERDIAAALGPEAYEQYLLRVSGSAGTIRNRYGAAIKDEAQYRQIFALQKAFDDRFAVNTPFAEGSNAAQRQERREAEQQLQQAIAAILGPEQAQVAQRSNDFEYRTLTALTSRLNLPAGTPAQIYAARDTYAAQSQQINANTALSREERSRQIRALGEQALADLQKTMGTEGAQTYAQRSGWLGILRKGTAFTTTPSTGGSGAAINFVSPGVAPIPPGK
jgi:hypothetical protein